MRIFRNIVKVSVIAIAFNFFFTSFTAHAASFLYYRSITVTSTNTIASGTNTNFPMLVSSTFSSWASSGNGGRIQNLVTAPNNGQEPADLIFATSTAGCSGTSLNFETESYTSSTGALIDWVNVPSVSTGTVIYACYGSSGVTTDQSHPSSTWNSNYVAVYHLPNPNGILNASDSAANPFNGVITAATSKSNGAIDGAAGLNGGQTQYIAFASSSKINTAFANTKFTISQWFYASSTVTGETLGPNNGLNGLGFGMFGPICGGSNFWWVWFQEACMVSTNVSTGTWHYATWAFNLSSTFYMDGVKVGTYPTNLSNSSYTGTYYFGASAGTYAGVTGMVDETEITSSTFDASLILTLYNNQLHPDDAQSSAGFYHVSAETSLGGVTNVDPMMCSDQF